MLRLAGAAALAAALLAAALLGAGGRCSDALSAAEEAIELHVSGVDALAAGERLRATALFEAACLGRHEPSCQAVWLQLELGSDAREADGRARLEGTARLLADATGGTWFPQPAEEGCRVRVYCPVEREADLRGALRALRQPPGG